MRSYECVYVRYKSAKITKMANWYASHGGVYLFFYSCNFVFNTPMHIFPTLRIVFASLFSPISLYLSSSPSSFFLYFFVHSIWFRITAFIMLTFIITIIHSLWTVQNYTNTHKATKSRFLFVVCYWQQQNPEKIVCVC